VQRKVLDEAIEGVADRLRRMQQDDVAKVCCSVLQCVAVCCSVYMVAKNATR